jgi:hypothetical protein
MPESRGQLRRLVGNLLGDCTTLVATVSGTTTTFIDTINLTSNIEAPRNRDIVFAQGGSSVTRRVTTYDLNAGWVAFDAIATTGPTSVNSEADMYNFRGKGWRVTEYDNALYQATLESRGWWKEPAFYDVQTSDIDSNGLIDISGTGLKYLSGVQYLQTPTAYLSIPAARSSTGVGWWTDTEANLVINGYTHVLSGASNDSIRLYGYIHADLPATDGEETFLPTEWVSNRMAAILCMSALDRDQSNFARGQHFQRMADMVVPSLRTRVPGSTRLVNRGVS